MEYMMVNGYKIPNLFLSEAPMPEIGKYGSLRKKFLAREAPIRYEMMQMDGTLYPHLVQINQLVQQQLEQTMQTLMKQSTAPDRRADPMGWTQWMNALKDQAEELAIEQIYTL